LFGDTLIPSHKIKSLLLWTIFFCLITIESLAYVIHSVLGKEPNIDRRSRYAEFIASFTSLVFFILCIRYFKNLQRCFKYTRAALGIIAYISQVLLVSEFKYWHEIHDNIFLISYIAVTFLSTLIMNDMSPNFILAFICNSLFLVYSLYGTFVRSISDTSLSLKEKIWY